jgi:hypothetical protein
MVQETRKQRARCQCDPHCREIPVKGKPFCKTHIKHCSRKAPLSGYETVYRPDQYNQFKGIKESHNCFAYAFDYLQLPESKDCTKDSCPIGYPQPGRASGYPKWSKVKGKRCPDLIGRLLGDVPGMTFSTFEGRCPKGMRKIAPVVDEDEDYHFYRQDSNGLWSHKPGATDVSRLDATKRLIYDPRLASRLYPGSGLHYDQFCGYMCVPSTKKHKLKRGGSKRSDSKRSDSKRSDSKRSDPKRSDPKRVKHTTRRHLRNK